MKLIKFFNKAGATGHVFLVSNGKRSNKGLAYSGLIGPGTTVAVVPTVSQAYDFSVEVRTSDNQLVTVNGNLKIIFKPQQAIEKFDFTVEQNGSYVDSWQNQLRSIVIEEVLAPVQEHAKTLKVDSAVIDFTSFQSKVMTKVSSNDSTFTKKGIEVESCSISSVEPNDDSVAETLGVNEREEMLTKADKARHDRRTKAAENERTLKEYEVETAKKVEEKRGLLISEQSKNKEAEAQSDAKATEIRMKVLADVQPGKILGAALMEIAKSGRLGSVSLTTELLSAIKNEN